MFRSSVPRPSEPSVKALGCPRSKFQRDIPPRDCLISPSGRDQSVDDGQEKEDFAALTATSYSQGGICDGL
jgi:hypothetical protein